MVRKQTINSRPDRRAPTVVDERPIKDLPSLPQGIDAPVRAVVYVEVGDATPAHMALLASKVSEAYAGKARGGEHYIIPVRHGKVACDVEFEGELLETVRRLCEVQDGAIVLRGGTRDVHVVRELA